MYQAAILDMYNGELNRGIPMLKRLMDRYANVLTYDRFDVRAAHELPDLSYDLYIFSGGPGNPLENDGPWFDKFFSLMDDLYQFNKRPGRRKKYCLFICHSFQMACHHFGIGRVTQRARMSFGTYPVYRTAEGKHEPFFDGLPDPFYIADFRRFQVLYPDKDRLKQMGASVLCLEKRRPHTQYERALMGVRFSPQMLGTQFHPEADPAGMLTYFQEPERRRAIEEEHGEARYYHMIRDLKNPEKILRTFETIVPRFLEHSMHALRIGVPSY